MPKHIVLQGPVDHDGKVYADGDTLDVPADAAAVLLELGVVEVVVSGKKSAPAAESQGD